MILILFLNILFQLHTTQPVKHDSVPVHHTVSVTPINIQPDKILITDTIYGLKKKNEIQTWQLIQPEQAMKGKTQSVSSSDFEPLRPSSQQSWLFYLILGLLFFIAFIRVSNAREFAELFYIFKPLGINQQLFRDTLAGVRISSVWLNINFVLVMSIYIFLLSRFFHLYYGGFKFLLFIVAAISILLTARFSLLKVASSLFPFKKEINFYNFIELQINRVTGLLILPLVVVMTFSPSPISYYGLLLSFLLLAAMLLFRYLRGFIIGGEYFARNKFHFLIYICALEIAPIVIFVKLLKDWMTTL